MSRLTTFGVALGVAIFLVIFFSIIPDGNPSEAAIIILEAFWLIAVLIKVIMSIIIVFLTAFLFILLSFISGAINFFLEMMDQAPISTTYLLDMQEDALDAVEVFFQGLISFLLYFENLVEVMLEVEIDWNPSKTIGSSMSLISEQGWGLAGGILAWTFGIVNDMITVFQQAPAIILDALWTGAVDLVQGTYNHVVNVIQDSAQHIINVGQDTVQHIVNVGQDTAEHIVNVVQDLPAAGQWAIDSGQEFFDHGVNVVQDFAQNGVNVVQDTAEHGVNVVQDTTDHAINVTHDAIDHTANVVQDIGCFFFGC